MTVTLILEILAVVQRVPAAVDAIAAWFRTNPNATPEQVAALLAEYHDAGVARRDEVARFNEAIK